MDDLFWPHDVRQQTPTHRDVTRHPLAVKARDLRERMPIVRTPAISPNTQDVQACLDRIRLTGRPTLLFNFFEKIHS